MELARWMPYTVLVFNLLFFALDSYDQLGFILVGMLSMIWVSLINIAERLERRKGDRK